MEREAARRLRHVRQRSRVRNLSRFKQVGQRLLLSERQKTDIPAGTKLLARGVRTAGIHETRPRTVGQALERVVIILQGQTNLLQMVGTLHTTRGFASGL